MGVGSGQIGGRVDEVGAHLRAAVLTQAGAGAGNPVVRTVGANPVAAAVTAAAVVVAGALAACTGLPENKQPVAQVVPGTVKVENGKTQDDHDDQDRDGTPGVRRGPGPGVGQLADARAGEASCTNLGDGTVRDDRTCPAASSSPRSPT